MAGVDAVPLSDFLSLASASAEPLSIGSVRGFGELQLKFVRCFRETIPCGSRSATLRGQPGGP